MEFVKEVCDGNCDKCDGCDPIDLRAPDDIRFLQEQFFIVR